MLIVFNIFTRNLLEGCIASLIFHREHLFDRLFSVVEYKSQPGTQEIPKRLSRDLKSNWLKHKADIQNRSAKRTDVLDSDQNEAVNGG